jgi:hypothetical protein
MLATGMRVHELPFQCATADPSQAQMLLGDSALPQPSPVPGALTRAQARPFQCTASNPAGPSDLPEVYGMKAHASAADPARRYSPRSNTGYTGSVVCDQPAPELSHTVVFSVELLVTTGRACRQRRPRESRGHGGSRGHRRHSCPQHASSRSLLSRSLKITAERPVRLHPERPGYFPCPGGEHRAVRRAAREHLGPGSARRHRKPI